ncbi:hypothetical protein P175DRAFT_0530700 [Aspergillus ochraceoroseus IBT 24754]|uniref:Uncharacterized protein n=1 Tax=Aspergillus ochraceoroseus IBT 24754 TaxID=1392256 RepID=A0A2T5M4V5_9EURO|nr:uncharacterized protein P175DRAFT_0530700 [Aspergillus ochraceoroseus IBT 24754]PTU23571.1 hypothetical protein P175DRAFT_0530700 [Aspergillus ochraceoroseus IBT 24754]
MGFAYPVYTKTTSMLPRYPSCSHYATLKTLLVITTSHSIGWIQLVSPYLGSIPAHLFLVFFEGIFRGLYRTGALQQTTSDKTTTMQFQLVSDIAFQK